MEGNILLEGATHNLGEFTLEITEGPKSNRYPVYSHPSKTNFDKSIYAAVPLQPDEIWKAKGSSILMPEVLM
jgi:mannosyl-oligosaccharide glucosidase